MLTATQTKTLLCVPVRFDVEPFFPLLERLSAIWTALPSMWIVFGLGLVLAFGRILGVGFSDDINSDLSNVLPYNKRKHPFNTRHIDTLIKNTIDQ